MPDYKKIYDDVFERELRYNLAESSPGFRAVVKETNALSALSGRSLDIGCGVGFVVQYLSGPDFDLRAFGVDVSQIALRRANSRMDNIKGMHKRLKLIDSQELPFENNHFCLVTCFDVLEHLDEADIETTLKEVERLLRPNGIFFGSVSLRKSGFEDIDGENLHRTVKSADAWIEQLKPQRATYDGHRNQLTFWRRFHNDAA